MSSSTQPLACRTQSQQRERARGSLLDRLRSTLFLLPAWFAPHSRLRVLFHRLRGVKIGKDVEIGYFCVLDNVHPGMITIEDRAVVAAGAVLLAHDNAHYYAQDRDVRYGPLRIGRRAFIGINSIVLPGITVGEQAIVGAMSVVTADVPAHCVVAGIPARVIRSGECRPPGGESVHVSPPPSLSPAAGQSTDQSPLSTAAGQGLTDQSPLSTAAGERGRG